MLARRSPHEIPSNYLGVWPGARAAATQERGGVRQGELLQNECSLKVGLAPEGARVYRRMRTVPLTKSETLKAKIGLSGPALNRIPGPAPQIPDHEMVRCIGQGSYGEVWLARNAVGTWRAIKVVYRQNFKDSRPYEREFSGIQSYEPVSRSNEGLIDVLQIGRNDPAGYFYYVMELADAAEIADAQRPASAPEDSRNPASSSFDPDLYVPKTLSRVIEQRQRLSYEECLTLGLTLNLALGHLHRNRLIHRDVKPSNIVFVNGVPKLTDIGLVTDLAGAQSFVGTEGFIPPEGPNSPQADLYALGKVLYEASMGKDRNQFPEPMTALGMNAESKALMELNAVLIRACAPDPKDRYQRAEEMNADLALLHNGESVRDKHALERRLKRMKQAAVITAAVIVLAVIPYYLVLRELKQARAMTALVQTEAKKSQEVARFLQTMLKSVEPSVALGRDTTMLREIVDDTRIRITTDLRDQPDVEAELRTTLGEVYQELGEYRDAETMLRRALDLRLQSTNQTSLAVAQTLSDLSPALWNQGKINEAEQFQRRALAIRSERDGADKLLVAESLQDLGCILSAEARMSEAEQAFRQALAIRQKALGPHNMLVAESLSGVANMLNAQGHWTEAELLFRQVLDLSRDLLSPAHPAYASALNGLVQALLPQGKIDEAEKDAREGLAIQTKVLGPDHPLVAASLTRLARVLQRAQKLPEAKQRLEQALAIWSKRFSYQDPQIGETLTALFDILLSEGARPEADRLFQQVLTPQALGERPNMSLLFACGNYHARTGQWTNAAAEFLKMVELDQENHQAYQALAALYVQTGDVQAYRSLCADIRARFGSITNDPRIADRMAKSCLILPCEGQDLVAAARLADVAVTFDAASAGTPWFQFCKGLAEYRLGHYQAATQWMQKVLLRVNEGSTRDVEAAMVLAMGLHHLGQSAEAREAFAEGKRLAASRLKPLESGDIEGGWTDWVTAQALGREAQGVLTAPPQAAPPQ